MRNKKSYKFCIDIMENNYDKFKNSTKKISKRIIGSESSRLSKILNQ